MAPTLIYRVETEQGTGPYHSAVGVKGFRCDSTPDQPAPWADNVLGRWWRKLADHESKPYLFGFANREQLTAWWDEATLNQLAEAGCRVKVFMALRVVIGDKQAVFRQGTAYQVEEVV